MENKLIYEKWELHPDSTQILIAFEYFKKIITVLEIEKLSYNSKTSNNLVVELVDIVKRWKIKEISILNNEFKQICEIKIDFSDTENTTLINLIFLLNYFKKMNYKSNEIYNDLQPRFLELAFKLLSDIELLEFSRKLCNRLFLSEVEIQTDEEVYISYAIVNDEKIQNTLWNIQNLILDLNDLNNFIGDKVNNNEEQNEIDHSSFSYLFIYLVTDFYVKLLLKMNLDIKFEDFYNSLIKVINEDIENKNFAKTAIRAIAIFLNKLIVIYNYSLDDLMIQTFLKAIMIITPSESFYNEIKKIVISSNYEKN